MTRVVAIATQHAGDVIVTTPVLRNLRRGRPDAHVTLLCHPATCAVLEGWDGVDRIVACDPRWPEPRLHAAVAALRAEPIDLLLNLTSERHAYRLGRRLRAARSAGVVYARNIVESLLARWWLDEPVRIWVSEAAAPRRPAPHRVEELLRINCRLGLPDEPLPLELPRCAADDAQAAAALVRHGVPECPPLLLHLGITWWRYGWRGPDLARLVAALAALAAPARLVVTCGPEDGHAVTALRAAAPDAFATHAALLGEMRFAVWAATIARAGAIVTPDTGALHVAAAVGTPVVAVYGRRRYAAQVRQWAPWQVPHQVLENGAPDALVPAIADAARRLGARCGVPAAGG